MSGIRTFLLAAAISLPLAGCSEEEPVVDGQADTPPAAEENQANDAGETAGDAMEKLRDAASSAIEGAGDLAKSARQAADRALEDAGPALEKAGELAGEFKESVDEIIAKAATDLERAARALEERIAESTSQDADPAASDPEAVLSPAENLNADTRAAARAAAADVGPAYVGVWAADAASCARIDQEAVEVFAVITPTTIRRYESVCNIEEAPLVNGEVTIQASCIAEGTEEQREISLSMPSADALRIEYGDAPGGAELARCHLSE